MPLTDFARRIVKVDAEDFRRVYESLNDEALLDVKRDELVPIAQQCYDAEVARRGLARGAVPAAAVASGAGAGAQSEDLAEVSMFTNVDDARFARDLLQGAEIPSQLVNADPTGSTAAFRLSVPRDFLEQAMEVLNSQVSDEELAAQAEAAALAEDEGEKTEPEDEV
jgi:hypothetical protein